MKESLKDRAIFIVLVSSADYMEAFDRLLQLNLQSVQEREIIKIILLCAGRVGIMCVVDCRKNNSILITACC